MPFDGPTAEVIIRKHLSVEPTRITRLRPAVPDPVADAVTKALAKTPADRFPTAEQFTDALAVDIAAFKRRHFVRRVVKRAAVVGAVMVMILVGWLLTSGRARRGAGLSDTGIPIAVLPCDNLGGSEEQDYYSDGKAVEGSGVLNRLKSIAEFAKHKHDAPLPDNESIDVDRVVVLRKGLKEGQVREGKF